VEARIRGAHRSSREHEQHGDNRKRYRVQTISMFYSLALLGSRSPSRQCGKRSNAYTTMPTTTAKMRTITNDDDRQIKNRRACGIEG